MKGAYSKDQQMLGAYKEPTNSKSKEHHSLSQEQEELIEEVANIELVQVSRELLMSVANEEEQSSLIPQEETEIIKQDEQRKKKRIQ